MISPGPVETSILKSQFGEVPGFGQEQLHTGIDLPVDGGLVAV